MTIGLLKHDVAIVAIIATIATSCSFINPIVMAEIPSFLKRGLIAQMATGCAYFAINPLFKKLGISAMTIGY